MKKAARPAPLRVSRAQSCEGKLRHRSARAAWSAAALLETATPSTFYNPINAYHCAFCRGWHVGHLPSRAKGN